METIVQSAVSLNVPKERRRELREDHLRRVTVTNLAQLKVPFAGRVVESSFSGMKLTLGQPVRAGSSLAIEWDDTCVLGDVVYCIEDSAKYLTGIKTNYVILDRTRFHRSHEIASRRRNG